MMPLSPIERMIDAACGYTEGMQPPPRNKALADIVDADVRLTTEAIVWWIGKRPVGWSEDEHLQNPTVNCFSSVENDLANAVANFVVAQRRYAEKKKGSK